MKPVATCLFPISSPLDRGDSRRVPDPLSLEVNGQQPRLPRQRGDRAKAARGARGAQRLQQAQQLNVHRGVHTLSEEEDAPYEGARERIAAHLGAERREVIFTRNVTGAINLVPPALGAANVSAGDRIVVTEMEHHSDIVPWNCSPGEVGCSTWLGDP